MNWLEEFFNWLFGFDKPVTQTKKPASGDWELVIDTSKPWSGNAGLVSSIPSASKKVKKRFSEAEIVLPVVHEKTYVFISTDRNRGFSSCAVCRDPEVTIFSDAVDAHGKLCRMCLRCLRRLGGVEQLELAAMSSKHAKRWLECLRALEDLELLFPNPGRRPYGEKSLTMEMKQPFFGFPEIERIISKIQKRAWTSYDLALIEGQPTQQEPSGRAASSGEQR